MKFKNILTPLFGEDMFVNRLGKEPEPWNNTNHTNDADVGVTCKGVDDHICNKDSCCGIVHSGRSCTDETCRHFNSHGEKPPNLMVCNLNNASYS